MQFFSYDLTEDPDTVFEKLISILSKYEFKTFGLGVIYLKDQDLHRLRREFQPLLIQKMKQYFKAKVIYSKPEILVVLDFRKNKIELSIKSVFVSARYNKFSREIPQTYYYCYYCKGRGCNFCKRTGKLSETSVEELVSKHFEKLFISEGSKFIGAGREDMDVLMLGSGRPFLIELLDPKVRSNSRIKLKLLQRLVNKKYTEIKILNLRMASKKDIEKVKNTALKKTYRAIVECNKEISKKEINGLKGKYLIKQITPERVEKRRSMLTRERKAQIKKVKLIDNTHFEITVKTDAGLYIKEFVSGDKGRSDPSLSSLLGKDCVCKQLDVIKVC